MRYALLILISSLAYAGDAKVVSPIDQIVDCMKTQRYQIAIIKIKEYLGASVGDPNVQSIKSMLKNAWLARISELSKAGFDDEAIRQTALMSKCEFIPDISEQQRDSASKLISSALDSARNKKDYRRQLSINDLSKEVMDKAIFNEEETEAVKWRLCISLASDQTLAEWMPAMLKGYFGDKVPRESNELNPQKPPMIECYKAIKRRGWFGRAITLLDPVIATQKMGVSDQKLGMVSEREYNDCHALWYDTAVQSNNFPLILTVSKILDGKILSAEAQTSINLARDKVKRKFPTDPLVIEISKKDPISGKGIWKDAGGGIKIMGTVNIGDVEMKDGRGTGKLIGEITISSGSTIDDGTLLINKGSSVNCMGTLQQPVVVRNVNIGVCFNAKIHAENTIFINCNFHSYGNLGAQYCSRFNFNNCLIYQSEFAGLNMVFYGFKWEKSTWIKCSIPERDFQWFKDLASEAGNGANTVSGCEFWQMEVRPMLVSLSQNTNYYNCTMKKDPFIFDSSSNLFPTIYATPFPESIGDILRRNIVPVRKGSVILKTIEKPFQSSVYPPVWWAWLPIDRSDDIFVK